MKTVLRNFIPPVAPEIGRAFGLRQRTVIKVNDIEPRYKARENTQPEATRC